VNSETVPKAVPKQPDIANCVKFALSLIAPSWERIAPLHRSFTPCYHPPPIPKYENRSNAAKTGMLERCAVLRKGYLLGRRINQETPGL
jgi:hypothetical protein